MAGTGYGHIRCNGPIRVKGDGRLLPSVPYPALSHTILQATTGNLSQQSTHLKGGIKVFLGGINAVDVIRALRNCPVVHTGHMDVYQLPGAIVRVAVDALEFRAIRATVDSTPLMDGRKLVTIMGVDPLY
jgi:hypothetical protein